MKLLLAGDSTVADYIPSRAPMMGWGQALREKIESAQLKVVNFAKNGSSTKSFADEGRFANLLTTAEKGDIVLMQFGHNDQKSVPMNDYYQFLTDWVRQLQAKGARPILCSPVERRNFIAGQQVPTLKEYTHVLKQIANEFEIPFFDLNAYTNAYYEALGEAKSSELFTHQAPESTNYPVGVMDNTHFCAQGAAAVARYVAIRLQSYLTAEPLFDKYYYGACMYPEVWSKEIMAADVKRMKELKMNFARIGEFVWSSLEPEEGVYDFTLLEDALSLYAENKIDVCLCIPTPTPPRWLTYQHPERLITNLDGTKMVHGSRQHVCTNNDYFRQKAYALTQKVAAVAAKYPNVVAIQLDNEFKCHVDLCYCDACQEKWHQWLEAEYLEIANLNRAWGTKIWSEEYASFAEVPMPQKTPFIHNSSLMNAFRRFTAESLNDFAHGLCHRIRMEAAVPITHNTALGFNLLNEELFSELDVVGFDTYQPHTNYPGYLLNLDLWRNLKNNNHEMLLLETSTAHVGHLENYVVSHPQGYLPMEVFTGFAGGLKSFNYWHFRGHRYGVEQTHSCVVTAWGEPDRGYQDVVTSGNLIQQLTPLLKDSTYQSSNVAVLYSDNSRRVYNIETGGMYNYRDLITEYYRGLVHAGITTEVIQENTDFAPYTVICMPFIRSVSPTLLQKMQAFVAQGGKLLIGPMTGDRTKELAWPETNGLGNVGTWLGLSQINQFRASDVGQSLHYGQLKDNLDGLVTTFKGDETWEILGQSEFAETLIAKKKIDAGTVIVTGALPTFAAAGSVWPQLIADEILPLDKNYQLCRLRQGLVQYRRETTSAVQLYLANVQQTAGSFELMQPATDLLTGAAYGLGTHELAGYRYLVLAFNK